MYVHYQGHVLKQTKGVLDEPCLLVNHLSANDAFEEVSIEIFITVIRTQQQQDREVRTRANDQIGT